MTRLAAFLALSCLAACGSQTLRYDLPPQAERGKIPVRAASVEVREVSLPLYATQEAIYVETEDSALVSDPDLLWADDPRRAITEGVADALSSRTRAQVAAEPWPFYDNPEMRLDIRFNRALAGNDGQYRISGQYYVASNDGTRPDLARRFDLSEPYAEASYTSIAAAQARVIVRLAEQIARDGL